MLERFSSGLRRAADSLRAVPLSGSQIIKGRSGNVIIVKTPNPMFSEAIFILKDDLFSSRELSRKDILNQAKNAAKDYTDRVKPSYPVSLLCFFSASVGASIAVLIMIII